MALPISAMRCAALEHIIESYVALPTAAAETAGLAVQARRSICGILAVGKQQVSGLRLTCDVRSGVWITLARRGGFPTN